MSSHAKDEWARARRCLESAEVLLAAGDQDGCAFRAYYSAFHAVTAYFLEGRESGKHSAVEAAVHRELAQPGRVQRGFGAAFTRLQPLRTVGDYGLNEHVRAEDGKEAVDSARAILVELRELAGEAFR
ncbi:MAG: HEPN domain-containing protein [Planctomycetes bacterium]|nr:HEPN domain-containing protein [Planctomycetota bacterium]